ncbi:MAG: Glu-tRNA(Gln) amidotransferase subunit GatE [Candidatus Woesearchaeota archaeon]
MDYKKLKFKCGLEIHKQLSGKKLFCECPTILRDDPHDILLIRALRAVAGELGSIDEAAFYESLKRREFNYEAYRDTNCLVEFDESPPNDLNMDALKVVLQVCKILKCKIVDEIQVMRKTVVDGSNTSGFQRTLMCGHDGFIETSKGKVRIGSICLEEDAARRVRDEKNCVVFRLDRLGIPLIEIATEPDIKTAEHAKEVAEKLGMILKSTGKVISGIGSIRQDVNVSIKNGNRVEIKGFQDLRHMPTTIEYEIKRQLKGNVKKEVRRAELDGTTSFLRPMPGASRMYPESDVKPIAITKELLKSIEVPELIDEKILRYEKEGLSAELARSLVKEGFNLEDYEYRIDKKLIANILVEIPKDMKSRLNVDYKFKDKDFRFVLEALSTNKITKDAVFDVMVDLAKGKIINLASYQAADLNKLEKEIKELVKDKKELSIGALMGIIMTKYKGKCDGKTAASLIAKYKNA